MAYELVISPAGGEENSIEDLTRQQHIPVSASVQVTSNTGSVSSVSCTIEGEAQSNLTITITGSDSFTISGTYLDPFLDYYHYVAIDSSDLLETPTIVVNSYNVPNNKLIFNLDQDTSSYRTKIFNIVIDGSETIQMTQKIYNDWIVPATFIDNYYDALYEDD